MPSNMPEPKETTVPDPERPALLLWVVMKITIQVFPLAILLSVVGEKLGAPLWPSMIVATIMSWWINEKYEELHIEVTDYIREKYLDQDPGEDSP